MDRSNPRLNSQESKPAKVPNLMVYSSRSSKRIFEQNTNSFDYLKNENLKLKQQLSQQMKNFEMEQAKNQELEKKLKENEYLKEQFKSMEKSLIKSQAINEINDQSDKEKEKLIYLVELQHIQIEGLKMEKQEFENTNQTYQQIIEQKEQTIEKLLDKIKNIKNLYQKEMDMLYKENQDLKSALYQFI